MKRMIMRSKPFEWLTGFLKVSARSPLKKTSQEVLDNQSPLLTPDLRFCITMVVEVPQHIHERLVAVIGDLRNAVGQEAAKAFLVSLTNVESVALEPETTTDSSWMEFINEDFMNDSSEPSQSTLSSPFRKTEDRPSRTTVSRRENDKCDPVLPLRTAHSPTRGTNSGSGEHSQGPEVHEKRRTFDHNIMEAVVQGLPRSDLLDCLERYWQTLTTEGIYVIPSRQVFTWSLEGSSEQARRLQHHLILRHLDIEDDLYQWRRSIAGRRNLDGYNTFLAELQAKQKTGKHTRRSGERSSSKAHVEYLAHIYADRTPKDYKRAKQGLQKDLRHGRRWSIMVDGFVANDGNSIPGLGLRFLLLCGSATARKM